MPTLGASVDLFAAAIAVLTRRHGGRVTAPLDAMNLFIAKLGEAEDAFVQLDRDPNWKAEPECDTCGGCGHTSAYCTADCDGCCDACGDV